MFKELVPILRHRAVLMTVDDATHAYTDDECASVEAHSRGPAKPLLSLD
jgi:hypothetical protein